MKGSFLSDHCVHADSSVQNGREKEASTSAVSQRCACAQLLVAMVIGALSWMWLPRAKEDIETVAGHGRSGCKDVDAHNNSGEEAEVEAWCLSEQGDGSENDAS